MRLFYVLYISDPIIQLCIDAARVICNPTEKEFSHITVRGPYKQRYKLRHQNRIIKGAKIHISDVGNFFNSKQNTVFLKCSSPKLKKVWKKGDYAYNPHLTIYDGESKEFAIELFDILKNYRINLYFIAEKLEYLESWKGHSNTQLIGKIDSYSMKICKLLDIKLNYEIVNNLTDSGRLKFVSKIFKFLSNYKLNYQQMHTPELFRWCAFQKSDDASVGIEKR